METTLFFLKREDGKERGRDPRMRERNTDQLPSVHAPTWDQIIDDSHSEKCEMISHCCLICLISLMISDIEHLFRCLLAMSLSSLEKYISRSFDQFSTQLFGFFGVEFSNYFINFGY